MLNLALVPYQMRLSLVIIGSSNYNLTSHFRVIADVVSAFPQSLHYSAIKGNIKYCKRVSTKYEEHIHF